MPTGHKTLHQSAQTSVTEHCSQVRGAISLSMARWGEYFKASAFKDSAPERRTDNYAKRNAIKLDGKILHSQTYATTIEDTDVTTQNASSQLFLRICYFQNGINCNVFLPTDSKNCNILEALLNAYVAVSSIRKMIQKQTEERIFWAEIWEFYLSLSYKLQIWTLLMKCNNFIAKLN